MDEAEAEEIRLARQELEAIKQATGPDSFETAARIDNLAQVLRKNKKTLEAVNLEAQAKMIRKKLGIDDAPSESEELFATRQQSFKMRDIHWLGVVGIMFVLHIVCIQVFRKVAIFSALDIAMGLAAGYIVMRTLDLSILLRGGLVIVWAASCLTFVPKNEPSFKKPPPENDNLAHTMYNAHQYEDSFKEYTRLLKGEPKSAVFLTGRAKTAIKITLYDTDAINDCTLALSNCNGDHELELQAYYYRAIAYGHLRQLDKALADFEEALMRTESRPRQAEIYRDMSIACKTSGKTREAETYYEKARERGYYE